MVRRPETVLRMVAVALPLVAALAAVAGATRSAPMQPNQATLSPTLFRHKARPEGSDSCQDAESTLTMIDEMPLVSLGDDNTQTSFEASDVTVAPYGGKDWLWVAFDNMKSLGRLDVGLDSADPQNALVGEGSEEDSQFEGISYAEPTGHLFAVEEAADDKTYGLVPIVHELELMDDGKSYRTVSKCHVEFKLKDKNKGFEGLHYYEEGGRELLLGLCEGNRCTGGARGRKPGHGRVVVTQRNGQEGDGCAWDVVKVVRVPKAAAFTDYSGIAFRGSKVAIVSQESSAIWVGEFDFEALAFVGDGAVYNFPRDDKCNVVFCNVEGVHWLDDARLVVASDAAKSDQPSRCRQRQQRLHVFALP